EPRDKGTIERPGPVSRNVQARMGSNSARGGNGPGQSRNLMRRDGIERKLRQSLLDPPDLVFPLGAFERTDAVNEDSAGIEASDRIAEEDALQLDAACDAPGPTVPQHFGMPPERAGR